MFFRLFKDIAIKITGNKETSLTEIYQMLKIARADYELSPQPQHPFSQLLSLADEAVATFMTLAETYRWYTDRSAFFKSKESIREEHIILSITSAKLKLTPLAHQITQIIEGNKQN